MIIPKLIEYLSCGLDVFVGVEAPEETSRYVLLDQTGSRTVNHIMTSTIAVQSYGSSLYEAMLLSEEVKGLMISFAGKKEVASVRLETDYNFTDTATKQYRWQAVYHITHYLGGI